MILLLVNVTFLELVTVAPPPKTTNWRGTLFPKVNCVEEPHPPGSLPIKVFPEKYYR